MGGSRAKWLWTLEWGSIELGQILYFLIPIDSSFLSKGFIVYFVDVQSIFHFLFARSLWGVSLEDTPTSSCDPRTTVYQSETFGAKSDDCAHQTSAIQSCMV